MHLLSPHSHDHRAQSHSSQGCSMTWTYHTPPHMKEQKKAWQRKLSTFCKGVLADLSTRGQRLGTASCGSTRLTTSRTEYSTPREEAWTCNVELSTLHKGVFAADTADWHLSGSGAASDILGARSRSMFSISNPEIGPRAAETWAETWGETHP